MVNLRILLINRTRRTRTTHEAALEMAMEHLVVAEAHLEEVVEAMTLATRMAVARMATALVATGVEAAAMVMEAATEGVEVVIRTVATVVVEATTVVTEATAPVATPVMEPAVDTLRTQATVEAQATAQAQAMGDTVEVEVVMAVLSKLAMVVGTIAAEVDTIRAAADEGIELLELHLHCMSIVKLLAERSMHVQYVFRTST